MEGTIAQDNELAVWDKNDVGAFNEEYKLEDMDGMIAFGLTGPEDMRRIASLLNEAADEIESR
jgi:hypothetical protein